MKLTTKRLKKLIREELNKIHESGQKTRDYHHGSDSQGRAYASQGQTPPKKPFQPFPETESQRGSMEMTMDMGIRQGENLTMLLAYYPEEVKGSRSLDKWYMVHTLFHLEALESLFGQLEEDMNSDDPIGLKQINVQNHIKYAKKIISLGKTLYKKNLKFLMADGMGFKDIEGMMNNLPKNEIEKVFQDNLPTWEQYLPKFDEYEKKLEDINLTFNPRWPI